MALWVSGDRRMSRTASGGTLVIDWEPLHLAKKW